MRRLIAYDISSDAVRGRVSARLEKAGERLQKSVFLVSGSAASLKKLEKELLDLLKENDSLLCIPCCDACYARATLAGKARPLALVA